MATEIDWVTYPSRGLPGQYSGYRYNRRVGGPAARQLVGARIRNDAPGQSTPKEARAAYAASSVLPVAGEGSEPGYSSLPLPLP